MIQILSKQHAMNNPGYNEMGAMLIMAYLSICLFLFLAILMLDVPYMERVGRSMQSAVDSASLAGTIQLISRVAANDAERENGWRNAKRAAIALLIANSDIEGLEAIDFVDRHGRSTDTDPLDTDLRYNHETYDLGTTNLRGHLIISRGVYHRPTKWDDNNLIQTFYRTEPGSGHWLTGCSNRDACLCIATRPTTCPPLPAVCPSSALHDGHSLEPNECSPPVPGDPNPRIIDVADAVEVTLTVNDVPTFFGRVLSINNISPMTRTAVSVPE